MEERTKKSGWRLGKTIKWLFLTLFVAILLYACVWGYQNIYMIYYYQSPQEKYFYSELNKKLKEGDTKIYLKDLTDFKWDRVEYLAPYSLTETIFVGKDIDQNAINMCRYLSSEGRWGLLFLKGGEKIFIKGKKLSFGKELKFRREYNQNVRMIIKGSKFILKDKEIATP